MDNVFEKVIDYNLFVNNRISMTRVLPASFTKNLPEDSTICLEILFSFVKLLCIEFLLIIKGGENGLRISDILLFEHNEFVFTLF